MITPTEEEFLSWQAQPITQWWMSAYRTIAEQNEAIAKDYVWDLACTEQANQIDTHKMTVLAEKAKAYRTVYEADYDTIAGYAGDE